MNIKTITIWLLSFIILLGCITVNADQKDDLIFKAVQDELDRTMSSLQMEDLDRPYFVSYTVDDYNEVSVRASLGTLTSSEVERLRYLTVDLRVGSYQLDNSNFVAGFSGIGANFTGITIDNDYDALRNSIYLLTDLAYKDALKMLSKKEAYLQARVINNRPDDHFKLEPTEFIDKQESLEFDKVKFENLAISATEVFRDYPMIISSVLGINVVADNQYFVNSNRSKTLRGDKLFVIDLNMSGKAENGENLSCSDRIIINKEKDLPSQEEIKQWALANAEKMKNIINGEILDEYLGPVIFTNEAVGEFFRQLFVRNISNIPMMIFENDQLAAMMPKPEFGNKINRRVLPAFFDVYDDPTITKLDDLSLVGSYEVDDAGIKAERVQLIEKGRLVSILTGTAPTKKIKKTNGHARGGVSKPVMAKPANMVFNSTDEVSYKQLVANMLEMCKDIDLDYGIVIKRITDINAPRETFSMFGAPQVGNENLRPPLEIYKVYADGREIPVRGLEFANVTVRILKDILQTDNNPNIYNYLIGDDWEMPASIVSPSILLEEMELKKKEGKIKKPPILSSPLTEM